MLLSDLETLMRVYSGSLLKDEKAWWYENWAAKHEASTFRKQRTVNVAV